MQQQMPRTFSSGSPEQVLVNFQNTSALMVTQFIQANQSVMMLYLQSGRGAPPVPTRYTAPVVFNTGVAYSSPVQPQTTPTQNSFPQEQILPTALPESTVPSHAVSRQEAIPTADVTSSPPDIEGSLSSPNILVPEIGLDVDQVIDNFVRLVSERTGYPVDMLEPDLDLESDLGIDSIKRVEIISKFRTNLSPSMQQKLESNIEQVAGVRTIREISEWIRNSYSNQE